MNYPYLIKLIKPGVSPALRGRTISAIAKISFAAIITIPGAVGSDLQAGTDPKKEPPTTNNTSAGANLREEIPEKYRERYNKWKAIFLSVESGRSLWLRYAANPTFHLTIIVSKGLGGGARTEGYEWKEGKLAAATILLGSQLDQGCPPYVYYPVLSSFAVTMNPRDSSDDDIFAAAKIAHEFGHINLAAESNATSFQLQDRLAKVYASQLLSNGHNIDDPALMELARRMGGRPDEIGEQREYLAEMWALRYLRDKLATNRRRKLLKQLRKFLKSNSPLYVLPSPVEWAITCSGVYLNPTVNG
jgi:hypothetical protein